MTDFDERIYFGSVKETDLGDLENFITQAFEWKAEIEAQWKINEALHKQILKLMKITANRYDLLSRVVVGLDFYADKKNYVEWEGYRDIRNITEDEGDIARHLKKEIGEVLG